MTPVSEIPLKKEHLDSNVSRYLKSSQFGSLKGYRHAKFTVFRAKLDTNLNYYSSPRVLYHS